MPLRERIKVREGEWKRRKERVRHKKRGKRREEGTGEAGKKGLSNLQINQV